MAKISTEENKIPVNTGRLLTDKLIEELQLEAKRMGTQPFRVQIALPQFDSAILSKEASIR